MYAVGYTRKLSYPRPSIGRSGIDEHPPGSVIRKPKQLIELKGEKKTPTFVLNGAYFEMD